MKFTLPNIISFSRVVLAPIFFVLLTSSQPLAEQLAVFVFTIGALTDYFDGWIARKRQEVSSFGIFFDPLADKVLTSAAFFAFVKLGLLPFWMVFIVTARDIATTLLRMYADHLEKPIITSRSAKVKTFAQMIFIVLLLLLLLGKHHSLLSQPADMLLHSHYIQWGMLIITVYTLWTMIEYVLQNKVIFTALAAENWLRICKIGIATLGGAGFSSIAPGTVGTAFALLIVLAAWPAHYILFLALLSFVIGLWAVPELEKSWGYDSARIVIDEAVGMWIVLSMPFLPHVWWWLLIAFALFRLFDIWKPFPVSWLNAKKGAFWVFADDIAAALLASIVLYMLLWGSAFGAIVLHFITQ
jgi:CDP-diacylglycerol--glycerol-3-phosphate 3-phosphatidyltransferase